MLCLLSMLLSYFDVFYDLLLNRHTATWNLLVLHHQETKNVHDVIYTSVLKLMISENQCEKNSSYNINNRENITIIFPSQAIPFAPGLCSGWRVRILSTAPTACSDKASSPSGHSSSEETKTKYHRVMLVTKMPCGLVKYFSYNSECWAGRNLSNWSELVWGYLLSIWKIQGNTRHVRL